MNESTTSSRTEGQKTKYTRLIEDIARHAAAVALQKIEADKDGWQRVIEHGDELKVVITEAIVDGTRKLSITDEFAEEEVTSGYGYVSDYQPKPVSEQLVTLRALFPELGTCNEQIVVQPVPQGAEGWFLIPRWQQLAATYGKAVEKVLAKLAETRGGNFQNYRAGQLGPKYLRQLTRTVAMFAKIEEEQAGQDILVVPAQFGVEHRGRSARRARAVMKVNEFGLGAFAVGIMLLTHPERLQHYDDLWIDCAGDEYSLDADGRFDLAPYFAFDDGLVKFGTGWVGDVSERYGSASGFLSQ